MRTKEEILIEETLWGALDERGIYDAMDEYAKQIAIAFAKFAMRATRQDLNVDNEWNYGEDYEELTDEELFNQFLQSLNKEQ